MDDRQENLELYKVMVSTITANEARRQQISSVFLSLIGLGSAGAGAFHASLDFLYISVPGAFLSMIWWMQIGYLKRLAKAKFDVIEMMENKMAFQPFATEWRIFKGTTPRATLSEIEMLVPMLCFLVCAIYTGARIVT